MINKEQYLGVVAHEYACIKHLAGKIPEGKLDWKPTEKQRTTLEVMQYLSMMGIGIARAVTEGNSESWKGLMEASKSVTKETFAEALDKELEEIRSILSPLGDDALAEEVDLWGAKMTRGMHLVNLLSMIAAYKMQLFLYIKASGNGSIGTSDLWKGADPKPAA